MPDPRRLIRLSIAALAAAMVLTGCASKAAGGRSTHASTAAPRLTSAPPTSPSSQPASSSTSTGAAHNGHADLTLSGTLARTLHGVPADCAYYYPAMKRGVVYTVSTPDFLLQVSDSEGSGVGVVLLNVNGAHGASYTNRKDMPGTIVAKLDRSQARLDVVLRTVVGANTVHVAGTITCP